MKSINRKHIFLSSLAIVGCILLSNIASVNALDKTAQIKLGETEYLNNCAACHGKDAKGNGPVAAVLTTKPFDLTMISKRFDGKYHRDFVYKVINGHEIISYEHDNQAMVFGRIMSLVAYLESIQVDDTSTH